MNPDRPNVTTAFGSEAPKSGAPGSNRGTVASSDPSRYAGDNTPYYTEEHPPEALRDPDWLRSLYIDQKLGSPTLGRMTGRSPMTVRYHLRRHGIPIRPTRISRHPCANQEWLYAHYGSPGQYRSWCARSDVTPDPDGGRRLSLGACASIAGVTAQTVKNWLRAFCIRVRDRREAGRREDSAVIYP